MEPDADMQWWWCIVYATSPWCPTPLLESDRSNNQKQEWPVKKEHVSWLPVLKQWLSNWLALAQPYHVIKLRLDLRKMDPTLIQFIMHLFFHIFSFICECLGLWKTGYHWYCTKMIHLSVHAIFHAPPQPHSPVPQQWFAHVYLHFNTLNLPHVVCLFLSDVKKKTNISAILGELRLLPDCTSII